MKSYYSRLSKEEKKTIKSEFKEKEEATIYRKANRIIVICCIGVLIGCISEVFDYIYKTGTLNYILDGLLIVFSFIILIKMATLKKNMLNKYALSKKENN